MAYTKLLLEKFGGKYLLREFVGGDLNAYMSRGKFYNKMVLVKSFEIIRNEYDRYPKGVSVV